MMPNILTQFIPSGLITKSHIKGIFINITLEYSDIEKIVIIAFPLSDDGKQQVEFFMSIIDETAKQIIESPNAYTSHIAKMVSQELNTDYKQTEIMINKFAKYDKGGYFALPIAYNIEIHDGNGYMTTTDLIMIEEY